MKIDYNRTLQVSWANLVIQQNFCSTFIIFQRVVYVMAAPMVLFDSYP